MSLNTEHIAQLAKDLNKNRPSETRHDRDMHQADILTSIIDAAEEERARLVGRLRRDGASWAAIGLACGLSKQGAQQRWTEKRSTPVDEDQLSLPGTAGSK